MIAAWDYAQVCRVLANAFRYRYRDEKGAGIRMVGLLFAPPEARLARDEIVPSLDYFHHRSGNNIDIFCAGYRRYGYAPQPDERPVTRDDPPWFFSIAQYERFRREIERLSRWRYGGEVDLLLLNARFDQERDTATLDSTSAIGCDLDRMIKDGAIQSVRRFFEDGCRFAENTSGADPTWGFSDELGLRTAGSALKRVILALLPKKLGEDYRRAEHFVVRDISAAS